MKPRRDIPRVSAKKLAADPSLQYRRSTIAPKRKPSVRAFKKVFANGLVAFIGSGENSRGQFPANLSELSADCAEFAARPARKAIARKPRTPADDLRIHGSLEFREWLRTQPCACCGWAGAPHLIEQCHAESGGIARKADATLTFPGCGPHWKGFGRQVRLVEGCHAELHRVGVKTFEKKIGRTLRELAAQTQSQWLAHLALKAGR